MMSDAAWLNFLKTTSLICNGVVFIIALIFLFGPKAFIAMSKFFDTYHRSFKLEKLLFAKARIALGIVLLTSTLLMLILVINLKI